MRSNEESLAKEAVEALRRGRADEARERLQTAIENGVATGPVCLILAVACRQLGDGAGEESALDRLLAIEPRAVRGLIMKGDCRARAADDRSAVDYYRTALRIGAGPSDSPEVTAELRRAQAAVTRLEALFAQRMEASLAAKGLPPENRSPRFQHALDIVAGRKQIYVQEPTVFFFPELPQIQFYDRAGFAWVPAVEAATGAIRAEILALMAGGMEGFRPYIQSAPNRPRMDDNQLLDNRDWSALFLCENGTPADAVIARCPRTWEAIQAAPLPRINPHTGVQNTRLTCHLPLIVPPGCRFRVGNEVREWHEGEMVIFDDTIEHEAWNDSGEDRMVLIFDIWRPELTGRERAEVAALFGGH